ncbi:MAG: hemerythrin domain-containing protein [Candidatus Dadabacteria bacterium]
MRLAEIDYTKHTDEIVRSDYRAAAIFRKYGISYNEPGMLLKEACRTKDVPYDQFVSELENITQASRLFNRLPVETWKTDFLLDYVVNVHHVYLQMTVPEIEEQIAAAIKEDSKCEQLPQIKRTFHLLAELVMVHSKYEEETIFPYIRHLEHAHRYKESYGSLFIRTLRKPLALLDREHVTISKYFDQLEKLTNGFIANSNCVSHQVLFSKMAELKVDLAQHLYLEEKIIFPRAIEIEKEVMQL